MTKFIEGQEVRVSDPYSARASIGRRAVVTKVGRTVVSVRYLGSAGEWEDRFDIETGAEKRPRNAGGLGSVVRTLAEVADRCHRQRLFYDLSKHHIDLQLYNRRNFPTAKLVAVLDAADAYDRGEL